MIKNVALTQNGNEYKKSNIGKIIGNTPAILATTVLIADSIELSKNKTLKNMGGKLAIFAGAAALLSTIGTAIGSIIDSNINKTRMAQADGEAKLNNNQ